MTFLYGVRRRGGSQPSEKNIRDEKQIRSCAEIHDEKPARGSDAVRMLLQLLRTQRCRLAGEAFSRMTIPTCCVSADVRGERGPTRGTNSSELVSRNSGALVLLLLSTAAAAAPLLGNPALESDRGS